MRFDVLGPFRMSRDGTEQTPNGRVPRLLLALLLVHANRPVPADVLIDAVWPDDRSGRGPAKLQLAIHRVRLRLDSPDKLIFEPGGYRLQVSADEYDVAEFDRLADRLLRPGATPTEVAGTARRALDLWRGRAFDGIDEVTAMPEATRCEERCRWVFEVWCDAELDCGRGGALIGELELRCAEEPLQERYAALLMRALHSRGRTADALAVYRRTRAALVDELGIEPGIELRQTQARVLAGEPRANVPDGPEPDRALRPAQLPPAVELTGRGWELSALGHPDGPPRRLITGMGGVGKTAIALAWAHRYSGAFPDGQLFLDLRSFSDDPPVEAEEALQICLWSLGVPADRVPAGLDERSKLFRSLLSSRRVLIVLDNVRSADQIRPLLPGSGPSTVIVTSRNALSGLVVRDGAATLTVRPLNRSASVQLLTALIGPRADRADELLGEMARLCADLPLALRVAAQQVVDRVDQSPAELVAELADERDRLDLLDAGDGSATDVRAVLSWSYLALEREPAALFRMLGLVPGADADVPALAALSGIDRRLVRRRLDVLARAHLIERSTDGRYRQHDLLRAYATELAERIDAPADRRAARARLLRFYAHSAATAAATVRPDDDYHRPTPVMDPTEPMTFADLDAAELWLDREQGNVLAAAHDAEPEEAASVLAIAATYDWRLIDRGLAEDGIRLHTRELALARRIGDLHSQMRAMSGVGYCRLVQGDFDGAEAEFEALQDLDQQHGSTRALAGVCGFLGMVSLARGRLSRADALFEESIRRYRASERSVPFALALAHQCRGVTGLRADDPVAAEKHFRTALDICERDRLTYGRLDVLAGLAEVALISDDPVRADGRAGEVVDQARQRNVTSSAVWALATQGRARMALGDREAGRRLFREATRIVRLTGRVGDTMLVLDSRARVPDADSSESTHDPSQAYQEIYSEAIGYAQRYGFDGVQAGLRARRAELLVRDDDPAGAAAELEVARRIYTGLDDPRSVHVANLLERLRVNNGG